MKTEIFKIKENGSGDSAQLTAYILETTDHYR